jgi:hypothetical protein
MFAACLAKRSLNIIGDETMAWVRQRVTGAVETSGQEDIVH